MSRRKQRCVRDHPRTRDVHFRVSDEDATLLRRLAEREGVTVSRLLVESAKRAGDAASMKREAERAPIVKRLELIRAEIWRIGHNVNQIARNVNRDMDVTPADEMSVSAAVSRCAGLLDEADRLIARAGAVSP